MPRPRWARASAVLLLVCAAGPVRADSDFSGQLRLRWDDHVPATQGPYAQAVQLAPELISPMRSGASAETELHGRWKAISAAGLLRQQRPAGGAWHSQAIVNELYASGEAAGWQFSAGRKIVDWDVGYGFRPNDVVQQEARRTLAATTPQGRALVQAEHFTAETAWSLAWVNPQRADEGHVSARGADEQALALRVYQRAGAADWHGFARVGEHTRGSVGAALSWVAGDSVELHASARWADRADVVAIDPHATGLVGANPYRPALLDNVTQALIGATWTGESKLSVMAEAWYDGTADSASQWSAWAERNRELAAAWTSGGPQALRRGVAGNLAWRATAFTAPSLHRGNVFLRAAWEHEGWQPSIDLLFMPADRGRIVTLAIGWQGNRLRVDAGLRSFGGPAGSVAAQLPDRRKGYAVGSVAF